MADIATLMDTLNTQITDKDNGLLTKINALVENPKDSKSIMSLIGSIISLVIAVISIAVSMGTGA